MAGGDGAVGRAEPRALLLFAHGAGAPSSHAWMRGWRGRLEALGRVETFDYPYMREGRRAPDRLPKLVAAHREALAARREEGVPVVLIGKSMGGRVGCHVALEEPVDALVCLGYPLKGARPGSALRDAVLVEGRTPVLFVQGTRDRLCPLDLLGEVRARMRAPSSLHVVEDGDHSLAVRRATLRQNEETQEDVDTRILAAVREFLGAHLPAGALGTASRSSG